MTAERGILLHVECPSQPAVQTICGPKCLVCSKMHKVNSVFHIHWVRSTSATTKGLDYSLS